jgi:hypothetical protein
VCTPELFIDAFLLFFNIISFLISTLKILFSHDVNFKRLALFDDDTQSSREIGELTYRELIALPLKSGERPPKLVDALQSAADIGRFLLLLLAQCHVFVCGFHLSTSHVWSLLSCLLIVVVHFPDLYFTSSPLFIFFLFELSQVVVLKWLLRLRLATLVLEEHFVACSRTSLL